MAEGFDKTLRQFAEEENRAVDYDALRRRILEARAEEENQKKARFAPSDIRKWGLLAACLVLVIAAGTLLARGGMTRSKAEMAAPAVDISADEAAEAAPAEAARTEAALMEAAPAEAAPAAAEAPMLAIYNDSGTVYPQNEAAQESAAVTMGARSAEESAAGAAYDPYTILVNRSHPLAEDYVPENMLELAEAELPNIRLKKDSMLADPTATAALSRMLLAAEADGVTGFILVSSYRSYEEQAGIWAKKLANDPDYGKNGMPVASMPPGESEHQTGLAFDITSRDHPSMSRGYADTEQAQWLAAHAHEYGFILRYAEGKEAITGVIYEPWHFRYVGEGVSHDLFESGLAMEEVYGE